MALISPRQLAALEALVNRALTLDPLALERLGALANKSIRIECTDLGIDLVIDVSTSAIHLQLVDEDSQPEVTAHLTGESSAFVRILTAEDKAAELINADLRLQGDSGLLIELQEILSHVELDWEFHLARVIGDLPAHALGRMGREGFSWLKNTQPILMRHIQEFILEEARLSPTQGQMDAFVDQVQHLDERVERLQARLRRLADKHTPSDSER